MRRTLAVAVITAAFLAPAAAASAAPAEELQRTNASCNNGHSGNYDKVGHGVKTAQIRAGVSPACGDTETEVDVTIPPRTGLQLF